MKVLIVSGFLGSGKTTFIRELISQTNREIAILENEYASSGIDGSLLKNWLPDSSTQNIWEMTEGCICCSKKQDFATSVLTIANTRNPEYLVVEPTGVGMLSSIIGNIQQIEYEQIQLLSPITIVDAENYGLYYSKYPEIFKDQILASHTLVLSKCEGISSGELSNIKKVLLDLNPEAEILTCHYHNCQNTWWTGLLEKGYHGDVYPVAADTTDIMPDSYSLENVSLDSPDDLILLLEDLIRGRFGNIFRSKGILKAGEDYWQFDVVDGKYALTGHAGLSTGHVVFIGENINRQMIRFRFPFKSTSFSKAGKLVSKRMVSHTRKEKQL